jgi:hypothetical protein
MYIGEDNQHNSLLRKWSICKFCNINELNGSSRDDAYAHHIVFFYADRLQPGSEAEASLICLHPGEFCVLVHNRCLIAICQSGTLNEGEWGECSKVCIILG